MTTGDMILDGHMCEQCAHIFERPTGKIRKCYKCKNLKLWGIYHKDEIYDIFRDEWMYEIRYICNELASFSINRYVFALYGGDLWELVEIKPDTYIWHWKLFFQKQEYYHAINQQTDVL